MLLALATASPALVVGGVVLVGLALAAAGALLLERAGSAISVVTPSATAASAGTSTLVGGLTEVEGVRVALEVIVVAGLAVFFLSPRSSPRNPLPEAK